MAFSYSFLLYISLPRSLQSLALVESNSSFFFDMESNSKKHETNYTTERNRNYRYLYSLLLIDSRNFLFSRFFCSPYSRYSPWFDSDLFILWCPGCSFLLRTFDIFFPFWVLPFCPMIESNVSKVFHPFSCQAKQNRYLKFYKNYIRLSCYLCFTVNPNIFKSFQCNLL